jgi:hypothetical protein
LFQEVAFFVVVSLTALTTAAEMDVAAKAGWLVEFQEES